jgi:hypothetical protein
MPKAFWLFVSAGLAGAAAGCGGGYAPDVTTTPLIRPVDAQDFRVTGKVVYAGSNLEYLPRTVLAAGNSAVVVRYEINESYDCSDSPAVMAGVSIASKPFEPPSGVNIATVEGRLEISSEGRPPKVYQSRCVLKQVVSAASTGWTFSQLRRRGLLEVRNNLESQMCHEREQLRSIQRLALVDQAARQARMYGR